MRWVVTFAALAGALLGAARSDAAMKMILTDGTVAGTVQITDGGAGDGLGATTGAILFAGTVGTFTVNVTTGLSKPVLGGSQLMDLNSINVAGGAGTLTIYLTDTDFGGTYSAIDGSIGGTLAPGASLTAAYYANGSNGEFDIGGDAFLSTLLPLSYAQTPTELSGSMAFSHPPAAFSGSTTANGLVSGPFSLTMKTVLVHTTAGSSSFDFEVSTPEPASILAWSTFGLAGLGYTGWRRRKPAAK